MKFDMKKQIIRITFSIFFLFAANTITQTQEKTKLTIYFFKSDVCPSCIQASKDLPDILQKYPQVKLTTYSVRNSKDDVSPENNRNIQKLIAMLKEINAKLKEQPFIYENKTAYPFVLEKNVPHYQKKLSEYTTIKVELPVPVFIIGDKVIAGYQKHILQREIASAWNIK